MRVTAKQVAEVANVALPTCYEALRGAGRLNPETRKRILEVAERLNYKPSAAARAMNSRMTGQIGIIGKLHPVSADVYLGANAAILNADRVMSILAYQDDNLDRMQQRAFKERMFDGMIVVDQVPSQILGDLAQVEHCIWANTGKNDAFDCIHREEFEVGRTAAQKLVEAGWKEIVYVYGPQHNLHYSHIDRLRGIQSVGEESRVKVVTVLCPESGTTWHQLDQRLSPHFAEAAFVFSDTYRVRAMQTLFMHRGLLPGRDLSIVCCDDVKDFKLTWPELSRAEFDRQDMGQTAVEMLLQRIATGKPQPSKRIVSQWIPGETIVSRSLRKKTPLGAKP